MRIMAARSIASQNAIRRLREQLDIKNIVAQHVAQYQELYQGTVP